MSKLEEQQFQMPEMYKDFPELIKKWKAERERESMFTMFFDVLEPLTQKPVLFFISIVIAYVVIEHPEVFTEMFSGATKLTGFALGLLK